MWASKLVPYCGSVAKVALGEGNGWADSAKYTAFYSCPANSVLVGIQGSSGNWGCGWRSGIAVAQRS